MNILITGASKGIGAGLAKHLLAKGDYVAGISRSAPDYSHYKFKHYPCDVTNDFDVVRTVKKVKKDFATIDVLINCAGIACMNHVIFTSTRMARDIMAVNFHGTFLMTREVARLMIKQQHGRIINFSSIAAPLSLAGESVYAASKAAVESFTRTTAKELAPFGITVNAIGPGPVDTDMIRGVSGDKLQDVINRQVIQRKTMIADIAKEVDHFIDSEFTTATVIYTGGI